RARWVIPASFASAAVVLGMWINMPWPSLCALGLLSAEIASTARHGRISRWAGLMIWCATLMVPANLFLVSSKDYILDPSFVLLAWLVAVALVITCNRFEDNRAKLPWR